jgi:hypothetical protein
LSSTRNGSANNLKRIREAIGALGQTLHVGGLELHTHEVNGLVSTLDRQNFCDTFVPGLVMHLEKHFSTVWLNMAIACSAAICC